MKLLRPSCPSRCVWQAPLGDTGLLLPCESEEESLLSFSPETEEQGALPPVSGSWAWGFQTKLFCALFSTLFGLQCDFHHHSIFLNIIFFVNKLKAILAKGFQIVFGSYFLRLKNVYKDETKELKANVMCIINWCVSLFSVGRVNDQTLKRVSIETIPKWRLLT